MYPILRAGFTAGAPVRAGLLVLVNDLVVGLDGLVLLRARPCVTGSVWFLGSGWQERSERLFTLAGEVERKLGKK